MKKLLVVLILIFTLQTPSQADDIRDFQIEGMSIGDSLLDFMTEAEIKKESQNSTKMGKDFLKFNEIVVYRQIIVKHLGN